MLFFIYFSIFFRLSCISLNHRYFWIIRRRFSISCKKIFYAIFDTKIIFLLQLSYFLLGTIKKTFSFFIFSLILFSKLKFQIFYSYKLIICFKNFNIIFYFISIYISIVNSTWIVLWIFSNLKKRGIDGRWFWMFL